MTTISKSQFKPRALEIFRRVERTGEEVVITDHGRPVVRLIPYREDPEAAFQGLRGSVIAYDDPMAPVGMEDWESLE